MGAYHFSACLQTAYVEEGIQRLAKLSLFSQHWVNSILFGDYGIGSLGTYSYMGVTSSYINQLIDSHCCSNTS